MGVGVIKHIAEEREPLSVETDRGAGLSASRYSCLIVCALQSGTATKKSVSYRRRGKKLISTKKMTK